VRFSLREKPENSEDVDGPRPETRETHRATCIVRLAVQIDIPADEPSPDSATTNKYDASRNSEGVARKRYRLRIEAKAIYRFRVASSERKRQEDDHEP